MSFDEPSSIEPEESLPYVHRGKAKYKVPLKQTSDEQAQDKRPPRVDSDTWLVIIVPYKFVPSSAKNYHNYCGN